MDNLFRYFQLELAMQNMSSYHSMTQPLANNNTDWYQGMALLLCSMSYWQGLPACYCNCKVHQ